MASQKQTAEDAFLQAWCEFGLATSDITREHHWHPTRRWRFDFAFPTVRIAVEIEGRAYNRGAGGHQSFVGQNRDCEKNNAAVEHGWRVLRYTTAQLRTVAEREAAVEQVCRVICGITELPDDSDIDTPETAG